MTAAVENRPALMGTQVVIALENSSFHHLDFAIKHLLSANSRLRIVTVHLVPEGGTTNMAQMAQEVKDQANADIAALVEAEKEVSSRKVPRGQVSYHSFPGKGQGHGEQPRLIAETLLHHMRSIENAVLVLSSHDSQTAKQIHDLGRVGTYCLSHAMVPTFVVKQYRNQEGESGEPSGDDSQRSARVCICMDSSENARAALSYAATSLLTSGQAQVHVITVALDQGHTEEMANGQKAPGVLCHEAVATLKEGGVSEQQIFCEVVQKDPSVSDGTEGALVARYCEKNSITLCVMGSRGTGAELKFQGSENGLGSFSEYCVHNLACAVCTVRQQYFQREQPPVVEGTGGDPAVLQGGLPVVQ